MQLQSSFDCYVLCSSGFYIWVIHHLSPYISHFSGGGIALLEISSGDMAFPESIICQIPQAMVEVSKTHVTMWIHTSRIGEVVIFFFPVDQAIQQIYFSAVAAVLDLPM